MATIAKGMITLVNVNDAYSVSVTPSACAIKADYDGSNPVLDEAFCDICVIRGDIKVPFVISSHKASNNGIIYEINGTDGLKRMSLISIPSDVLSGNVEMEIATEDEFVATVIFQYSVTREATMLDWIKDWETNKTSIGSTYMITPKLFVGKRENVTDEDLMGKLTGVYIGPSDVMGGNGGPGIYGYKAGETIFYINKDTAQIANWYFDENSLWLGTKWNQAEQFTKSANDITIGSFGLRGFKWRLDADGSGALAGGNISWNNKGELTILIDDEPLSTIITTQNSTISNHTERIGQLEVTAGGLTTSFSEISTTVTNLSNTVGGIEGEIAGMGGTISNHTERIGQLEVTAGGLTTSFSEISTTVGEHGTQIEENKSSIAQTAKDIKMLVEGLTSTGINIEDGSISLHSGNNSWQLNSDGDSYISGWLIKADRLATDNVAFLSTAGVTGLYMSISEDARSFKTLGPSILEEEIDDCGGIYMQCKAAANGNPASANLAAYNANGKKIFKLKTDGVSSIAGWNFNNRSLYTGEEWDVSNQYTASGDITIGANGIRGYKWRLENDGSGAIAGGNIAWNAQGEVSFSESVSLHWKNDISEANAASEELAIIARQMAYGKMLYRDPEFSKGFNDAKNYPFHNEGGLMELKDDSAAPNSTHTVLHITATKWNAYGDWRLTGFCFATQSRANAKFVVRIVAKIPLYWKIENYHNQYGAGSSTKWLTSQEGTGAYQEYVCVVSCGASGTFSTVNHFALILSNGRYVLSSSANSDEDLGIYLNDTLNRVGVKLNSVEWDVAYATVIDISSSDKLTTAIDINGIYTGTLRADQIIAGEVDVDTITAGFIISNGDAWALNKDGSGWLANKKIAWTANGDLKVDAEIEAKNVISPFIRLEIKDEFNGGSHSIGLGKAYNLWIAPTSNQPFIFLPTDLKFSGVTITICYGYTDGTSLPINLLCGDRDARFFHMYRDSTFNYHNGYRVIQLSASRVIRLQAIPNIVDGQATSFLNWYIIGPDDLTSLGIMTMKDGYNGEFGVNDNLWEEYHRNIIDTLDDK